MAFVNEIVSDADIDRYHLPFRKGSGRYWTRDAERDYYLWGGKSGSPQFGEKRIGSFFLSINQKPIHVTVEPGRGSIKYTESPFVVRWETVIRVDIPDDNHLTESEIIPILKEALIAYGEDGRENKFTKGIKVEFGF